MDDDERNRKTRLNVRAMRIRRGMSVNDLAERTGVMPELIKRWERGDCVISPVAVQKLAKALQCSTADLLK